MPLFYFHLRDELGPHPDEGGIELLDVETAYLEAFRGALGLWGELLEQRRDPRCSRFEVTDETGEALFELPFSEVLESTRGRAEGVCSPLQRVAQTRAKHMMALTQSLRDEIALAQHRLREARDLLGAVSPQR